MVALLTICFCVLKAVRYKGSINNHPTAFKLDGHHLFETGKVIIVQLSLFKKRIYTVDIYDR